MAVNTSNEPQYSATPLSQQVQECQNPMDSEEEGINLRDFFLKCLINWRWFVLSVLICLGFACFYVLRTPKTFTRTAEVVIKNEDESTGSISSTLSNMGLFQPSSTVANELMTFQSPALAKEVIERLDLQTDYTYKKFLRPVTLYGDSLIVKADFIGFKEGTGLSFELDLLGKGKVSVSELKVNREEYDDMEISLGDTIDIPGGRMVIIPGPAYKPDFEHTIKIRHSSIGGAIQAYQNKITIEIPNEDADVIQFVMNDVNIQRAQDYITSLISIYNERWIEDKEKMAIATSNFINDRLAVIEKELGTVDSDIASFKGEHLVPDLQAASEMFMNNANENTKRQMEVSTQITIVQFVMDYIQLPQNANNLLPANAGIENDGINNQITEYNKLVLERNNILAASGPNSPLVKELNQNLSSMKSALIATLSNQKRALQTQLNTLIASDRDTNAKIASSPNQAKYLLSVERQQKVKESLYLFLLQKREENELSLAFTPTNLQVITPPMGNSLPTSPVTRNILLIAFVLGLLIPAIVIFISENLNNTVRSKADLDGLRAPFIGEIPEAGEQKSKFTHLRRKWRYMSGKESRVENTPDLLVHDHGRSILNESFRMVRASLEFMLKNGRNKVIMVTSFNPGSGKSFISLNLAAALAVKKKESRILIIDLDLRRASLSRIIPDRQRGVSDYLSESVDDVYSLIKPTQCSGLYVLPVGTIPPNPSELLYSDRLQSMLEQLKKEYDYIFLDCPPAEIVADTTIITPLSDLTLFVVRSGLLDKRLIPELNHIYDIHRYNNLMVILNGTTVSSSPYRRYVYSNSYYSRKD